MKKALFYSFFILQIGYSAEAQVYSDRHTQHRFAQSYIGLNAQVIPSQGELIWNGTSYKFPSLVSPRLTVGGLHFWGKLDFNFNIPLALFYDDKIDRNASLFFSPGGDLSVRYYPWRMIFGRIRPYMGISTNTMQFGIDSKEVGERYDGFITGSMLGGVAFATNGWQLNAELMWLPKNERKFYSSNDVQETLTLPQAYLTIGLIKYVDFTLVNEKDKESGKTERWHNELKKSKKVNSFSISIAPSAAYFLMSPTYENQERISIPDHKGEVMWEFGLGYLFHSEGIHVGLSYRTYTSSVESYGLQHLYKRKSLALEGLFFLLDYNGFVPFIGPSISHENWLVGEFENDVQVGDTRKTNMISPGVVFGWDIVPSPLETWTLRTNLRYYPFQKVEDVEGKQSRVDQFEFNFIELVLYPSRMINVPQIKKRF